MPATAESSGTLVGSHPGVRLTRLKVGTLLVVHTTTGTYRLRVLDPMRRLFEVRGADHRLNGVIGCLVCSVYGPERSARRVWRPGWVGYNTRMQIRFLNHLLTCDPTLSLRIEGDGWYYDVF